MIINETKYPITSDNYVANETQKKLIVIGHTNNHDMRHVTGWLHRYNGKYKKTAAFTIDAAGSVYQHFDPKYHSRFFNNAELDCKTIVILLENDGWLTRDIRNNELITWNGDIYRDTKDVIVRNWRGQTFWAPYTIDQFKAATELVKTLCEQFNIPVNTIGHNTKLDDLMDNNTILYRSNLNKHYTDLSPAWDFRLFKNLVEHNYY